MDKNKFTLRDTEKNTIVGQLVQHPFRALFLACFFVYLVYFYYVPGKTAASILLLGGFGLLLTCSAALFFTKRLRTEHVILFLLVAGFLLRLAYIFYTSIYTRQHDMHLFTGSTGHAGYINYFYERIQLPDFDPRTRWQFYHPPLHHFTAAMFMRINTNLGMSYETACESIQILTLFYSSACMLLTLKILRLLKLKGAALFLPLAIVCFHPSFILLAGSINNDILSITLMFGAIYAALLWNRKPTVRRILLVALCIGGAMMAKTSGFLIAPAVAFIFLRKAVLDRAHLSKYIGQFVLFGIVCVPLGLWWSVYNYIRWDMPLNYVPRLGTADQKQYVGFRSVWERLFGVHWDQLGSVYMNWGSAPYYEYNVFIGLLKTSLFGELSFFSMPSTGFSLRNFLGYSASVVLFYSNLCLVVGSLISMVVLKVKKYRIGEKGEGIFFFLIWFVVFGMYIMFCFTHPHTCTQNFRYAVPTLLTGVVFIGKFLEYVRQAEKMKFRRTIMALFTCCTVLFCGSTVAVYFLLGW